MPPQPQEADLWGALPRQVAAVVDAVAGALPQRAPAPPRPGPGAAAAAAPRWNAAPVAARVRAPRRSLAARPPGAAGCLPRRVALGPPLVLALAPATSHLMASGRAAYNERHGSVGRGDRVKRETRCQQAESCEGSGRGSGEPVAVISP
jgi:hypothetical protein